MNSLRNFLRDDEAATAIEYALIASMIAAVIAVTVLSLGTTLRGAYQNVSDSFA
ncbi:MAG: Flp family type IVb pilin [Alphaproteobacteria bacterium]|nr:Flp family type IVb pilin [Alphaproteobacteria bacterium]